MPPLGEEEPGAFSFVLGVFSAIALSGILTICRKLGVTSLNPELLIGSAITHTLSWLPWAMGFVLGLLWGGVMGMLYALGMRTLRRSGITVGLGLGLIHWSINGALLGFAAPYHPVLQTFDPGYFASRYGGITMLAFILAHLCYGAFMGGFYILPEDRLFQKRTFEGMDPSERQDPQRKIAA